MPRCVPSLEPSDGLDRAASAWSAQAVVNSTVFLVLLLASCFYALWRGGPPERIGAVIYLLAAFATLMAVFGAAGRYNSVEPGILIIDGVMLAALLILALRAERFWPIWATGLHAVAMAGHAVKLMEPEVIRWAYAFALAFWSYPMLLVLVLGTRRHQARLKQNGADPSWSNSFDPSDGTPPIGPDG